MRLAVKLALAALVVAGLMTAAAADQSITWVSVSADGTGHGGSGASAVSDDGRFVAFTSNSGDLVAGDSNGLNDVFVKDMETGSLEMVSVSSNGTKGNDASGETVDISNDGRYVLFDSEADNLVTGDTNGFSDMFIHDRQTGTTERALRDDGGQGGATGDGSLSGDGRYVAFSGVGYEAALPSTAGVYVFDRVADTTERVTDGTNFLGGANYNRVVVSDDARFVAFATREFNSGEDVILFDRQSDTWEVANPRLGGAVPLTRHGALSISGNGRFVAFGSPDTNYVAGDTPDTNDVFVYDSSTDSLERIPVGGQGSAPPLPVISDDGRYVAFVSQYDNFGEANNQRDVVVYDRQADSGQDVSVFNDGSPGNNVSGSYLYKGTISGTGRYVVFSSHVSFDSNDPSSTDFYIVDMDGVLQPPGGECQSDFTDVGDTNVFASDICWLADQGITRGCNPPANTEFCPKDPVTRGQMAAFLVRALGYTDNGGGDLFTDDDSSVFEGDIDRLGTAGVTRGCNPPANTEFCPTNHVTRGQMAAFLVRALGYTDNGGGDLFTDDDSSVFEGDIDRLGTAGVTRGCNPPANDRFCPLDDVTREQMAAFLRRALGG